MTWRLRSGWLPVCCCWWCSFNPCCGLEDRRPGDQNTMQKSGPEACALPTTSEAVHRFPSSCERWRDAQDTDKEDDSQCCRQSNLHPATPMRRERLYAETTTSRVVERKVRERGQTSVLFFSARTWTSPWDWPGKPDGPGFLPDDVLFHELVHTTRMLRGKQTHVEVTGRPNFGNIEEYRDGHLKHLPVGEWTGRPSARYLQPQRPDERDEGSRQVL